ncbi:hypothetical protein Ancab_037005, partial [Ancistrocladus abbreviatus]
SNYPCMRAGGCQNQSLRKIMEARWKQHMVQRPECMYEKDDESAFAFLSKVAVSDLEACAAELRNGGQVSGAESRDGCYFSDKTLESVQRTVGGVLVFSSCGRGPFAEK